MKRDSTWFSFDTLKLQRLTAGLAGWVLLGLILLLLAAEALLRSPLADRFLPAPTIGREMRFPEVDVKFRRLEQMARRGEVNCFFFGSSMGDAGLDPVVFEAQLRSAGITDLHCFNFSVEAFMAETSADFAEFLVRQYHPRLVIFGTSALEYDAKRDARRGAGQTPWLAYCAGQFSWEGWLVDHSYLYRYLLALPKYRDPGFRQERQISERLVTASGFRSVQRVTQNPAGQLDVLIDSYALNLPDWVGLQRIAALRRTNTQVIVLEMPVHPEFMPHYLPGGKQTYERDFAAPVAQYLAGEDVLFLRTWPQLAAGLPANAWKDGWHLNADGAYALSSWLAGQVAALQTAGKISVSGQ